MIHNKRSPQGHRSDNLAKRCPYCGGKVSTHFLSFVYRIVDLQTGEGILEYIHMQSKLPTKNTLSSNDWVRFDNRTKNNPQIGAKAGRIMANSSLTEMPTNSEYRVRYYIKNKIHSQVTIERGIYLCKCSRTMQIDGRTFSEMSYSERLGYDQVLTKVRQYIVNSRMRRT